MFHTRRTLNLKRRPHSIPVKGKNWKIFLSFCSESHTSTELLPTQASEHVDSLFVLKLFERRFMLKEDSKVVFYILCFVCSILRSLNLHGTQCDKANAL